MKLNKEPRFATWNEGYNFIVSYKFGDMVICSRALQAKKFFIESRDSRYFAYLQSRLFVYVTEILNNCGSSLALIDLSQLHSVEFCLLGEISCIDEIKEMIYKYAFGSQSEDDLPRQNIFVQLLAEIAVCMAVEVRKALDRVEDIQGSNSFEHIIGPARGSWRRYLFVKSTQNLELGKRKKLFHVEMLGGVRELPNSAEKDTLDVSDKIELVDVELND